MLTPMQVLDRIEELNPEMAETCQLSRELFEQDIPNNGDPLHSALLAVQKIEIENARRYLASIETVTIL